MIAIAFAWFDYIAMIIGSMVKPFSFLGSSID